MHLRAPSIDQGVHAFAWSVVFFLYMWLGALAIAIPGGLAFVVSLLAAVRDLPVRAHARRRLSTPRPESAQADASGGAQRRATSDLSLRAATSRSAKSRPIAASRRSSAGCFGIPSCPASALTSLRIRCEAVGATFVRTAALMERASAAGAAPAIPGGSERRDLVVSAHALVVGVRSDGAAQ